MRILIVSQVFWPDTASTAQHLYDLAEILYNKGIEVEVISSINAYEDKSIRFKKNEIVNGIKVKRVRNSSLGKSNFFFRICDFFTFNFLIFFKLAFISGARYDKVLGMTSPPLVSFIGSLICKLKKIEFCYWVMDLQPELSIYSGLIKKKSLTSKFLTFLGDYTIKNASKIIVLDKYMKLYLVQRGGQPDKIFISEVWSVVPELYEGNRLDNPFRIEHKLGNKIVIMYSGNHSYVHPLDTLLQTAYELKDDDRFLFLFIGGGVRKSDVTTFKEKFNLSNIIQLPYQPRSQIHYSLGSADLQVVIMGENLVGFTHPNKIYGAMYLKKPVLYVGQHNSHIGDILNDLNGNIAVEHKQTCQLIKLLLNFVEHSEEIVSEIGESNRDYVIRNFNPQFLKEKMANIILE